ncbi:MAG: M23 family metallopeptidase, partial [Acidobacteria bacterium]|nr:M23 family metallopeptidase [Acidobacteriota bacterium]
MLQILVRALATALLAALQFAGTASAQPPRFDFPADCTVGGDCWYRAYVDLASDATYRDHRCGVRSYENHRGTDIGPYSPGDPPFRVLAAAAGVVTGIRDGLDDSPLRDDSGDSSRQGVECGNGVRIDHGGGWATQYCHLRRGSVTVSRGARVAAGHVLGVIGSSGQADSPHLHFQVEREGTPVDPFTGTPAPRAASPPGVGAARGGVTRPDAGEGGVASGP